MQITRLRRLRKNSLFRNWSCETQLRSSNIILPYFVVEGKKIKKPIKSMPGVNYFSVDSLVKDISEARKFGVKSVLLFGIPKAKDELAKEAYRLDGVVQKAIAAIKKKLDEVIVITDVCLCAYTKDGHCGVIKKNKIDDSTTLELLAKIAVSHAARGADFVAPSAMMDGQVRAIRAALDKTGFPDVGIVAYSAKYASNFYGPFREALNSAPKGGDRTTYQLDYRNSSEALREIEQDIAEGADIVMIKPALAYLDIIYRAKERFNIPIAAYSVSGEYSMIKKEASGDRLKEKELTLEVLTAIKRAGADFIISYSAKEIGKWIPCV